MKQLIVLHDYFERADGGGRLSTLLVKELNADLCYGFASLPHPFVQGTLQNPQEIDLKALSNIPLWRQFKLARTFENKTAFLKAYKTVIYSGFYTPLAVNQHLKGKNILYCNTPPRFMYDQKEFYLQSIPLISRPLLNAFAAWLQPRYEQAIQQMDMIIANSQNIQRRIKRYLNKESVVIYPPCEIERFYWNSQGDYYLSFGRLDPLKRISRLVDAFLQMPNKKLIIASDGSEFNKIKQRIGNAQNIVLLGKVNEQKLLDLISNCIATIYIPKDEDFGLSPVESMAAGKPVLGVAEGGLLETIIHEETGILLPPDPTVEMIINGVEKLTPLNALNMKENCQQRAQQFSIERFLDEIGTILFRE
jgi:glycosyltransferase involved in cell wall biosynthesis